MISELDNSLPFHGLAQGSQGKWKGKVTLSANVVSLTANTCLLTEYLFICLWDIIIYFEPEVAFNCTVTGQTGAQ